MIRTFLRAIASNGKRTHRPGSLVSHHGGDETLSFDMFDVERAQDEARRAHRLEQIYHLGQDRIWSGKAVLDELIGRHGDPKLPAAARDALMRILSVLMWGELAAWKISAQLADQLVALEPKLAATSQVHDESRHFYTMHDYVVWLGQAPSAMDYWSRRVINLPLQTTCLTHKIVGMQLTIETIALTLFAHLREQRVEPVLTALLPYFEKDEARHVGLGTQLIPALVRKSGALGRIRLLLFQLDMLISTLLALRGLTPALGVLGIDPRAVVATSLRKHHELEAEMRREFAGFPDVPLARRVFAAACEWLFPGSAGRPVSLRRRLRQAVSAWKTGETAM